MLLLWDCFAVTKPLSQIQKSTLWPLQDANPTPSLGGFGLRDSPTFDEWQLFQTEGLRRQLAQALEGLAWGHASDARFDAAIVYASRWLALDTLHEPAHRLTMQLYVWSGQRNAALRQYRECVRVLENELGVLPLEETTQLYETIKENQLASPSHPADSRKGRVGPAKRPASATQRSSTYPLVGRMAEMTAMAEASEAIGNDGRLLVLEGEAGIGKTRLAEAFIERTSAVGNAVLTARCYEGESALAYSPIIEWLKEAEAMAPGKGVPPTATRSLSEAARLLPELRGRRSDLPEAPRLDSLGAQRNFYEGVCDVLARIHRGRASG